MSELSDSRKALLFLFERPFEPMYVPKPMSGGDSIVFNMPREDVVR